MERLETVFLSGEKRKLPLNPASEGWRRGKMQKGTISNSRTGTEGGGRGGGDLLYPLVSRKKKKVGQALITIHVVKKRKGKKKL